MEPLRTMNALLLEENKYDQEGIDRKEKDEEKLGAYSGKLRIIRG